MRVVVEKVHKVKARVTSAGDPQLYSVAMPEAAAKEIVDAKSRASASNMFGVGAHPVGACPRKNGEYSGPCR
jgi:hypothetical protein